MLDRKVKELISKTLSDRADGYSQHIPSGSAHTVRYSDDILLTPVDDAFEYVSVMSNGMIVLCPKAHNEVVIMNADGTVAYRIPFDVGIVTTMLYDGDCYYTDAVEVPNNKVVMIPRSAKYFMTIDLTDGTFVYGYQMSQSNSSDRYFFYSATYDEANDDLVISHYKYYTGFHVYDLSTDTMTRPYYGTSYSINYIGTAYARGMQNVGNYIYIPPCGKLELIRYKKSTKQYATEGISGGTLGDHVREHWFYRADINQIAVTPYASNYNYHRAVYDLEGSMNDTYFGVFPSSGDSVGTQLVGALFYSYAIERLIIFSNKVGAPNFTTSEWTSTIRRGDEVRSDLTPNGFESAVQTSDEVMALPPSETETDKRVRLFKTTDLSEVGRYEYTEVLNSPSGNLKIKDSAKTGTDKFVMLTAHDNKLIFVDVLFPPIIPPLAFNTKVMDINTDKEFRMLHIPVEQADIDDVEQDYVQNDFFMNKAVGVLDEQMNFLHGFQFFYDELSTDCPIAYKKLTYEEFEAMAIQSSLKGYGQVGALDYLIAVPKIVDGTLGSVLAVNSTETDIVWDLSYTKLLGNNPFLEGVVQYETVEDETGFFITIDLNE